MQGFQVYDVMKNGARVLTADYARGKFNVYHYEDSYIVVDVPKNGLPWIDRVENRWVHAAHFAIQRVADGLKAEQVRRHHYMTCDVCNWTGKPEGGTP